MPTQQQLRRLWDECVGLFLMNDLDTASSIRDYASDSCDLPYDVLETVLANVTDKNGVVMAGSSP